MESSEVYKNLLKYRENDFSISDEYRSQMVSILFQCLAFVMVIYGNSYLPAPIPSEMIFFFSGIIIGAILIRLISIYLNFQRKKILLGVIDWSLLDSKLSTANKSLKQDK
jgi:hypothetical protein